MKKLSNQARQALPGVYEESATLDLKKNKAGDENESRKEGRGGSLSYRRRHQPKERNKTSRAELPFAKPEYSDLIWRMIL
jgi:hypothetical protein